MKSYQFYAEVGAFIKDVIFLVCFHKLVNIKGFHTKYVGNSVTRTTNNLDCDLEGVGLLKND